MTPSELASFVLAAYLAAAVILGACAVGSWLDHDRRRQDGGA